MKKLIALLLLLPVFVSAESFGKKENPNDVFALFIVESGCPVTKKEVVDIGRGVLIRSRLKQLQTWGENEPSLSVNLNCLDLENGSWAYHISAEIVRSYKVDEGIQELSMVGRNRGKFGVGRKDFILASYKNAVEDIVTDYLQANFDLGTNE